MKNGFIYARVSTEEQAKEGQSIESQLRICKKYAEDNDIDIVEKFVDEGKSATNMNRPALQDMLGLCQDKNQHIDVIILQDTDRLARNTLDHLKIKAILKKHKIQLIAVSQPTIDDSPEGNLMDTLLAATNAFQSQITGRKTSKVLEQKALAGWYPGGVPPLGYKNSDNPSPKSTLDRRIIMVDPSLAPVMREIFQMYSTGNFNTSQIADYLNEKNIKSPLNSKIHVSLAARTLSNPFYIGRFQWKGKEYNGLHEPLIEQTLFDKVQNVMQIHNQGVSRKRIHDFLLRGFLFCESCGARFWGEQHLKGATIYSFYYCKSCGKGTYTEIVDLEKQVQKYMAKIQISDEYKKKVLKLAAELIEESRSSRDSEKRRLDREQAQLEKAISDAEDDRYIHHTITNEDFNRLTDRYKTALVKIKKELANLDVDHSEKLKSLENILVLAENLGEAYKKAEPEMKREYLGIFFSKFSVKSGKIVSYDLTDDVKGLIEDGSVRVSAIGLPG